VTKLKDLKADHQAGIKRFFESAENSTPSKKKKLDLDLSRKSDEQDYSAPIYRDEPSEFFLDDEDEDMEEDKDDADEDYHLYRDSTSPSPTGLSSNKPSSSSKKPISSTNHERKSKGPKNETHVCPMCSRVLETDNQGLNEHVDFCLSKQAIKAAQTTAAIRERKL